MNETSYLQKKKYRPCFRLDLWVVLEKYGKRLWENGCCCVIEGRWCIVIKNIIRHTYPTAVVFNLGVLKDILHQSKWNRNHLKLEPALILALTKICP
jgi:hypothetical protein